MGFAAVEKDIVSRFQSNWGTTTRWTTDGDVGFDPPNNAAWVRVSVRDGDSEQVSLGNTPRFRHYGTIIIQVFVRRDSGSRLAKTHADTISAYYRNSTFGTPTIYCRAPYITNVGEREGWYQVNVNIPYQWDEDF